MVLRKLIIAACIIPFCGTLPTLAEEPSPLNLGQIVITRDNALTGELPSTAEVAADTIAITDAETVDEALDFTTGAHVSVGQKNEPEVNVRGFGQDKVLVLWDGIPIASPYYRFVDLNQIPAESIAKIKVIKTPTSVLYGANTMGGVINIISKEPAKGIRMEVEGGGAFHGAQRAVAAFSTASEQVSFWLSGSHRESEGFPLSKGFDSHPNEDGGIRENSDYKKDSVSLKIGFNKDDRYRFTAFANYLDNEKGIPPHISSNRPRYWRFPEWRRLLIGVAGESAVTDAVSVKGRAYYDKYDNTLKSFDDTTYTTQARGSSWTSIYDEYAAGASTYVTVRAIEGHAIAGAFNFRREAHKEQDDTGEPWEKYALHTYSVGVQDDITLYEKLLLSAGISYDMFDQRQTFTGRTGGDIDSVNPLASIRYAVTPELMAYSSVSKRTQFPTLNQLYASTSGNPNLEEQVNINMEAGVQYTVRDAVEIGVSYFYNRLKDLIDRASRDDPYLNISRAVLEGVETNIELEAGKHLTARIGYTYLRARDKRPDILGRSKEELPFLPEHKADAQIGYQLANNLWWHMIGSYHGKRYYYDGDGKQHDMGGYFVWNTKALYRFLENWEGSITLENIFDRSYQEEEGYPQPGRTIMLGVKGIF